MSFLADLKILRHLVFSPIRGDSHQERLESFYEGQSEGYDSFRARLLQGRQEMFDSLPLEEGGVWVDMGGGTGASLEFLGERIRQLRKIYVVDLSSSLLEIARRRVEARGWDNVELVCSDVVAWEPAEKQVDGVTFSYSLTMIPDWFAAVSRASELIRPGGTIGVVDFYVSRKYPEEGLAKHPWRTRTFWPAWFGQDNVYLSPDHIPFLRRAFETVRLDEECARVPYIPLARVPYYRFVGRRA